jgi:hypothetical protein
MRKETGAVTIEEQTKERLKDLMDRFRRSEEELIKTAEEIHVQVLSELMDMFPNAEFYYRPNTDGHWGEVGFGSLVVRPTSGAVSVEDVERRVLDLTESLDEVVSVYVKRDLSDRDRRNNAIKSSDDLRRVFYRSA